MNFAEGMAETAAGLVDKFGVVATLQHDTVQVDHATGVVTVIETTSTAVLISPPNRLKREYGEGEALTTGLMETVMVGSPVVPVLNDRIVLDGETFAILECNRMMPGRDTAGANVVAAYRLVLRR